MHDLICSQSTWASAFACVAQEQLRDVGRVFRNFVFDTHAQMRLHASVTTSQLFHAVATAKCVTIVRKMKINKHAVLSC
jgi:hypothetical protein